VVVIKKNVIIVGAAGRDFHNFNMVFRDNSDYKVIAFTATQIQGIHGRTYPKKLAGKGYPKGIPIYPQEKLADLIEKNKIDEVIFSYSDITHNEVMHLASIVLSKGASFKLLGSETMLKSKKPVIAICATRTGAGKSPATRRVINVLKGMGKRVVVIRHPMPYGNLEEQAVQRFETYADLKKHNCTIEEIEEYEPHINVGNVVYAGVDYAEILKKAEKEADVIVWDGGNNDTPFIKSDLHIVVADPRRAGHELLYHPGETNFRMADVILISKVDSAEAADVEKVMENAANINPKAKIIKAALDIKIDNPDLITGKKVLIVEDGPTATHGGICWVQAVLGKRYNFFAVNPRDKAKGSLKEVYDKFPHLGFVLPAMGYSKKQMKELEDTINSVDADAVIVGTPINISSYIKINKPFVRVSYDLREVTKPDLSDIIKKAF